jgi:hypothetical protein
MRRVSGSCLAIAAIVWCCTAAAVAMRAQGAEPLPAEPVQDEPGQAWFGPQNCDRVRLYLTSRHWTQGTVDSTATIALWVADPANRVVTQVRWSEIADGYIWGPRRTTLDAAVAGMLAGAAIGIPAGILVGRAQNCATCEMNIAPGLTFLAIALGSTVLGLGGGCLVGSHWTRFYP